MALLDEEGLSEEPDDDEWEDHFFAEGDEPPSKGGVTPFRR
jgi:hypothetical protein